jgi:aspartate beta-hydroxylase
MKFDENCKKCPKTTDLITSIVPRQYHHAFFSAINPGTHIVDHNGPTNRKLRLHIPIMNVRGARMRVGSETKYLEEGVPIVFDDSFNHEAWHDGEKTRINLIIDFWHPELSDSEVKFFKMLQYSKLK